ncbi:hypothetical protein [Bifidobacterium sp. ESL0820]|uniref:hypothetical protein n=1 Tax=Bifidobacterium sp. ESL0820 TaxID=3448586 RepID=UPI004041F7B6
MNAAEYLLDFFETEWATRAEVSGYRFADIVAAVQEVIDFVDSLKELGEDTALYDDCMSRIKKSALKPFGGYELDWSASRGSKTQDELLSGDLLGLKVLSDRMEESSLRFTETQRETIADLIKQARKILGEVSDDLPTGLALYINRLMHETEIALDEYSITGDFVLEKAFTRLRESLNIAIEKTSGKKKDKWNGVRKIFRDLAIGFIVETPSLLMTAAQVFPPIGS